MRKLFSVLVLVVVLTGCERPYTVYNACFGSWVMITSDGDTLLNRLDYGEPAQTIDIGGAPGDEVTLVASGFDQWTGRPLGVESVTVDIPRGGSSMEPDPSMWRIDRLETTDSEGGCGRRD